MDKIKVKRVSLLWSENPEPLPRHFGSLDDATAFLRKMSHSAPGLHQGYHKTGFKIEFEDGETYEGRYDLKNFDALVPVCLARHVWKFCTFYSGRTRPEDLPSHLTVEQYKRLVEDTKQRDEFAKFLDTYEIYGRVPSQENVA